MLVGISIALVILCGLFLYGNQTMLPDGKRYEHTHDGYHAVVVVSHKVTAYNTGFLFAGDKIEGADVAKACAVAMKVVDKSLRAHGRPGTPQNKKPYKKQIFHFLPTQDFKKLVDVDWKGNDKKPKVLLAYTQNGSKRFSFLERGIGKPEWLTDGRSILVIRVGYMNDVAKKGGLAVHEVIHEVHLALWGNRDPDHELWKDARLFHDGKSLNRVCLDNWLIENAK